MAYRAPSPNPHPMDRTSNVFTDALRPLSNDFWSFFFFKLLMRNAWHEPFGLEHSCANLTSQQKSSAFLVCRNV